MEKATFGAGCFWHVEDDFSKVDGVAKTQVGFMGGSTKNPSYEDVCSDRTGHTEVVQLEYDPDKVSYDELLKVFWDIHNPTEFNRQGPDIGTQYRSVIFYHNEEQKNTAEKSLKELEKSGKYKEKIMTDITPAKEFYPAEEYHQKYYKKHPLKSCLYKGMSKL